MNVGVVAIGRNEGDRLRACLVAARRDCTSVVYVDSGSTDGSVELAQSLGVYVVNLDLSKPFTAARARNEGFAKLKQIEPSIATVQFVDGDCEIVADWMRKAISALEGDEKAAVICGRRRERFPDASVYNRLCDIEWDTPVGPAKACGGDALIRVTAFEEVHGYNPAVIAGEEPEMCVRLRKRGWTIHRIDAEMTLHDAAITKFSQWWKRALRSGHAYAEGAAIHPAKKTVPDPVSISGEIKGVWDGFFPVDEDRFGFRSKEVRSIDRWVTLPIIAALIPTVILGIVAPRWSILGLLPILLYPLQATRVALQRARRGEALGNAFLYGTFLVLGKFPQWIGGRRFRSTHRRGEHSAIIEYK